MDQLQPISGPAPAESCEVSGEKECARSNQCGSCGVRFRFFACRGLGEHTGVGRFHPNQSADASGIGIAGRAEGTLSGLGGRSSGEVLTEDKFLSARDSKKKFLRISRGAGIFMFSQMAFLVHAFAAE